MTRVRASLGGPCFARRNKDWEALDLFLSLADVTRVLFQTSEVFFSSNAAGAGGGARGGGVAPLAWFCVSSGLLGIYFPKAVAQKL